MIEDYEDVLLNMRYLHLPNWKETGSVPTGNFAEQELMVIYEHLSFRYPGADQYSLRDINMTIRYGKKIALNGSNSVRKTTMIMILCRLYELPEGRILLNGKDIRNTITWNIRICLVWCFKILNFLP